MYLKRYMKKAAKEHIRGVCLDIGSGSSPYKRYLECDRYISVDKKSTQAVTYQENQNEVEADARELPFEDGYADTILLNQVLEHIFEYDKVLSETHRVLNSSGKLVISVPFIFHIHAQPNDYFRFSKYGLEKLLQKHGYKILEFNNNGYFGTAIISIINSFIWQVWNAHPSLKLLRNTLFLLPILSLFFINNLIGLILDSVKLDLFTPNYLLVCQKCNTHE
jgi:SAM-dependent methyltransferase